MERHRQKRHETRRSFLQKTLAAGSAGFNWTITGMAGAAVGLEAKRRIDEKEYLASREGGLKHSPRFSDEVSARMETYREKHMSGVIEHGFEKKSVEDPRLSRVEFVIKHFLRGKEAGKIPERVREELRFLIAGVAANESSYNNAALNGEAGLIFQFTEDTLVTLEKERAIDRKRIKLLSEQLKGVGYRYGKAYANLLTSAGPSLKLIKTQYFNDDDAAFDRQFVAPLIVNTHIVGPNANGMPEVVNWFASQPRRENCSGYDVFLAMVEGADAKNAVPSYGEHSSNYVEKIYAFSILIQEELQKRMRS